MCGYDYDKHYTYLYPFTSQFIQLPNRRMPGVILVHLTCTYMGFKDKSGDTVFLILSTSQK